MLSPEVFRKLLADRFAKQHRNWLAGDAAWPLSVPLGIPTEKKVLAEGPRVRDWVTAWQGYAGPGELVWEVRQFPRLGQQRLPKAVVMHDPASVAFAVSDHEAARWRTATARYEQCLVAWPHLATSTVLRRNYEVLADYAPEEFDRLVTLLDWIRANPASGLFIRQIPVPGLDTKWIEDRRGLVMDLLQGAPGMPAERDFYAMCGLLKAAHRIRLRVLCPTLRAAIGGLCDVEAPVSELASLQIRPAAIVIIENKETGVALPDLPGCVAIMGLGNAVAALASLPWIGAIPKAIYWGDVDTHGFAILDRARAVVPHIQSVFMDPATVLAHRTLCGQEPVQCPDLELPRLTPDERACYLGLREQTWGAKLRLEQERLPLAACVAHIRELLTTICVKPGRSGAGKESADGVSRP